MRIAWRESPGDKLTSALELEADGTDSSAERTPWWRTRRGAPSPLDGSGTDAGASYPHSETARGRMQEHPTHTQRRLGEGCGGILSTLKAGWEACPPYHKN